MSPNIVEQEGPKGSSNSANCTTLNHSNILRERKDDVYKKYEIIQVLGNGSMGAVTKVKIRDECLGGSAHNAKKTRKGHPILNSFRELLRGSGKKSNSPNPSEAVVKQQQQLHNNTNTNSAHDAAEPHNHAASPVVPVPPPQVFALKSIQLDRISPMFLKELENEIDILRNLDHPNIVKAHEVYWSSSSKCSSAHTKQIYIVMDCCDGGDLFTRSPYSERQSARITASVTSAIKYMHDHGVVHRDLKFENIMFESRSPKAQIKILDFGLSKKFGDKPGIMTDRVGTVYTMAPQVLQGIYSSQADLWSVGVITYMLLSATKPFYHKRRRKMIDLIMRADYSFQAPVWETISENAKDFVSKLLVVDPEVRMDATAAIEHTWIVNREQTSDEVPSEALLKAVDGSLLNYVQASSFKKLALNVIAHQANSSDDILRLRNAFKAYDTSGNGVITYQEFEDALKKMKYSTETIQEIFNSIDLDRDGDIEYTEFLAATIEVHGHIEEIRIAEAFDRLDEDDSGYISKSELKSILALSPECVDELIAEADTDKDGKISYPEFLALFRQQTHQMARDVIREAASDTGSEGTEEEEQLVGLDSYIPGGKFDSNLVLSEQKHDDEMLVEI